MLPLMHSVVGESAELVCLRAIIGLTATNAINEPVAVS